MLTADSMRRMDAHTTLCSPGPSTVHSNMVLNKQTKNNV